MLVLSDLGFLGGHLLLLVCLVVVGPAFLLAVRWRWRLAGTRREEVARLAALAAEEAARVEMEMEMETAVGYGFPVSVFESVAAAEEEMGGVVGVGGERQCAVCYSPTTTRCSRCKAVRYCSGKCQIIHWRQGHKEECHPPSGDDHCNGQVRVSNLKGAQAEQISATSFQIDGKKSTLSESYCSSEVFSEDDNLEDKCFVNTSGTESTSDSSSSSTFSGFVETLDAASASDHNLGSTPEHYSHISPGTLGEPLSSDYPDIPQKAVKVEQADLAKISPSEVFADRSSGNSASSLNSKQEVPAFKAGGVECRRAGPLSASLFGSISCPNIELSDSSSRCRSKILDSSAVQTAGTDNSTDCVHTDAGIDLNVSAKLSSHVKPFLSGSGYKNSSHGPAALEGTIQFETTDMPALGTGKSVPVARARSHDSRSNESRSPSPGFPPVYLSSSAGGHSALKDTSCTVDAAPRVAMRLFESRGSATNDTSDLKTSIRRRAFQSIKASRHYPSLSSKCNQKVLFPYDLFIKLYNSDKVELRPCGLTNCGNSCYANAVLQCLAFTRPLTAYILEGLHTKTCLKKSWCFTCEFESLLIQAKQGKSPLSPIGIISHIQNIGSNLGRGKEEDAHEFLRYAVDAMQSACLKEAGANAIGPFAEETTLIQLIFGGYLRSKIQCMKCLGKSERYERMMDLTVEIHGDIGTLEEALARFTATEILDGENKYQCNRCRSYARAKKKLTISEAPNILTIALKRYQSGKFGKLNKTVRFPETLNLAPYMRGTDDTSPVYKLYGVVVHIGVMNAAFAGHYVCYVKSTHGKWHKIDDSMVKPVELDGVLSKGAYMLFYARCSPRAPSFLKKSVPQDHGNSYKSKCKEDSKARSNPLSHLVSFGDHRKGDVYSHHMADSTASFKPHDLFDERLRHAISDSSSDSSSLFSCSDESTWSTDSTRDSISTEEYSEYIFGDSADGSWNSPLRYHDSDGFTYSPYSSRHSSEAVSNMELPGTSGANSSSNRDIHSRNDLSYDGSGAGYFQVRRRPFLFSDKNVCRNLTEEFNSRETDWVSPCESKSNVVTRRPSKERTAQTFY